jgi:cytochrome c oxidase subunit II
MRTMPNHDPSDSGRSSRLRLMALAIGLALILAGCAEQQPQNALSPEGPIAERLDDLINPVFAVAGAVFLLVQGLIIAVILKFRRKGDDDAPKQVHGNVRLEIGWTIGPAILLAVVGIFTLSNLFFLDRDAEGADVVNVTVTGHQWWWEYEYTDLGITTANELHIPAGRAVNLKLESDDVIHNFWPPKLAGKVYAIPGRTNHMVIEAKAEDAGREFWGQCAEYCGLSHANMRLRVVTHTSDEFEQWAEQQAKPAADVSTLSGDAADGASIFRARGCGGCHTVEGYTKGAVGPNLTHFKSRSVFAGAIFDMTEPNLRRWLRNPPKEKPMMPQDGIGMPNLDLTEDEITKLIAYLDTLK